MQQLLKKMLKILPLVGINDLRISFDAEARCVKASFVYNNQQQEKKIAFEEIEQAFSDSREGDLKGVGAPNSS